MKRLLLATALFFLCKSAPAAVNVRLIVPEQDKGWAEGAARVVLEWAPRIEAALGAPTVSNRTVTLEFKDMPGVAHTSGNTITISTGWIRRRPDDLGMVVHELTHVIQSYPGGQPGWMVEGIADHVRYFTYEPAVGAAFKPRRGQPDFRAGYLPAAAFLNWIDQRVDGNLIQELNAQARNGRMTEAWLAEKAGGSLDQLWADYAREGQDGPAGTENPSGSGRQAPPP